MFGNAIYASAFVAYAGPMDQKQREKICVEWRSRLNSAGIEFIEKLNFHLTVNS